MGQWMELQSGMTKDNKKGEPNKWPPFFSARALRAAGWRVCR